MPASAQPAVVDGPKSPQTAATGICQQGTKRGIMRPGDRDALERPVVARRHSTEPPSKADAEGRISTESAHQVQPESAADSDLDARLVFGDGAGMMPVR